MSERMIGYDVNSGELVGASWNEVHEVGTVFVPVFGETKMLIVIWIDGEPYGTPETLLMTLERATEIANDIVARVEAAYGRSN